MRDHLRKCLKP